MKRKNKYFLVLVLFLCSAVALYLVEPPPAFVYNNTAKDCSGRSTFIYKALLQDTLKTNYVFFGSSKTMNGVQDSLLSANGKAALNLGYCRYGRNLELYFAGQFLKKRPAKALVFEVREEENNYDHPLSAFLMDASTLARSHNYSDIGGASVFYHRCLRNIKYLRSLLFDGKTSIPNCSMQHGFWPNLSKKSNLELQKFRVQDSIKFIELFLDTGISRHRNMQLKQIQALAKEKQLSVYFLYLPAYGNAAKLPQSAAGYRRYGTLLLPPDSIICDANYFADEQHFNRKGAQVLTDWLLKSLP